MGCGCKKIYRCFSESYRAILIIRLMQTIRFDNLELDFGFFSLRYGLRRRSDIQLALFVEKQINAFGFDLSFDDLKYC